MARFPTHRIIVEVELTAPNDKEAEELAKKMFCSPFRHCEIKTIQTIVEVEK